MKYSKEINYIKQMLIAVFIVSIISCKTSNRKPYSTSPDIFVEDKGFKVVGYLPLGKGSIEKLDELELEKLTHLNLAFANPDKEGVLKVRNSAGLKTAVQKGHKAGLKVYISIAGGGRPDTTIWNSVLQPKNVTSFVKNILYFVDEYNLDGVDVDIEGNLLPYIGNNYSPFVLELRDALHAKGKGITSALGATWLHKTVTQEALEAYDFINVMVYDKTGPWNPNKVGPHSPYSFAEAAIKFWCEKRNISSDKIVLGMPFYGHNFSKPVGSRTYSDIVKMDVQNAYKDQTDSIYYDGIPTIVKKTLLAKKRVNGVMFWQIAGDNTSDLSLLRAVDQTLKAGDCGVITYYKDEDSDGLGNPAKPFQACTAPKGYVSNRNDKDDSVK